MISFISLQCFSTIGQSHFRVLSTAFRVINLLLHPARYPTALCSSVKHCKLWKLNLYLTIQTFYSFFFFPPRPTTNTSKHFDFSSVLLDTSCLSSSHHRRVGLSVCLSVWLHKSGHSVVGGHGLVVKVLGYRSESWENHILYIYLHFWAWFFLAQSTIKKSNKTHFNQYDFIWG